MDLWSTRYGGGRKKKKNVFLTFFDKLTLLKCTEEIYWSVCLPFSLPWLLFSCSTPSWISLRLSRSCLAKTWPLFITMMDLLSMRPWNSFRRRFFSCSFTLLSTATITSFSSRMDSVRSSKSSAVSVFRHVMERLGRPPWETAGDSIQGVLFQNQQQ